MEHSRRGRPKDKFRVGRQVACPIFRFRSSNSGESTSRETVESLNDTPDITARNIGTPVAATDPDTTDTLEYSLEGDDAAKFEIVTNTGLITTKIGELYDYETKTSYSVRVKVVDGNGGSDTIDVTLNFLNQNEPPGVVPRPTVTATQESATSLVVSWPAPIEHRPSGDYELRRSVQEVAGQHLDRRPAGRDEYEHQHRQPGDGRLLRRAGTRDQRGR